MPKLTHRTLQASKPGEWISDGGARGAGTLYARKQGESVLFYFRYTKPDGARDVYPLGEWSGSGGPWTLEKARERAGELSFRYRNGSRDLRMVLEAEEREAQRLREAVVRSEAAALVRQEATLGALLTAYSEQLKALGKASAPEVHSAIKRHVEDAWPTMWATPADDLDADDLMDVLTRLTDAGKLRQAAKLRSYLQAAYAAGIKAKTSASSTPALRALKIRTNPARDLATIDGAAKARDRALSAAELRAYWTRIAAMRDNAGACLRFHLLTGGQRLEQLAEVTVADLDLELQAFVIRDGKGRRSAPRLHVVPLLPEASVALAEMVPERVGPFLFTATAGDKGMVPSTPYGRCRAVMEEMLRAGELPGGAFSINDLRRTVETRLAALGVSKEVRAQLQSHGLGGVQSRHYDRHDYLSEKRQALEGLVRLLTEANSSNLLHFPRQAAVA